MRKTNFNKKNAILNLLLLITVFIVIFLISDIFVRIFLPQYKQVHKYDDYFVHTLIPNSKKVEWVKEPSYREKIEIEINEKGFRESSFPLEKRNKRIMVYGDSFIEGEFSAQENTFVQKLENRLNEYYEEEIDVINAGVSAYGPDQATLRMEQETPVYNPDLVIFSVFVGNDYGDLIRNKIYRVEQGNLQKNKYTINPYLKIRRRIATIFPSTAAYFQAVNNIKRSLAGQKGGIEGIPLNYVQDKIESNKKDCEEYFLKNDFEITNVFGDRIDYDLVVDPLSYCSSYKLLLMEKIFEKVKLIAEKNDAEFMVLVIPSKFLVDDFFYEKIIAREYPDLNRSYLTETTSNMLSDLQIDFIDLYPLFYNENINNTFYFINDGHWNNAGQDFAANIVADKIIREDKI